MLLSCRPQGLQLNFYPERSRHMEIFIKIADGGLYLDTPPALSNTQKNWDKNIRHRATKPHRPIMLVYGTSFMGVKKYKEPLYIPHYSAFLSFLSIFTASLSPSSAAFLK